MQNSADFYTLKQCCHIDHDLLDIMTLLCHPDVPLATIVLLPGPSVSMFREMPSRLDKEDSECFLLLHLQPLS